MVNQYPLFSQRLALGRSRLALGRSLLGDSISIKQTIKKRPNHCLVHSRVNAKQEVSVFYGGGGLGMKPGSPAAVWCEHRSLSSTGGWVSAPHIKKKCLLIVTTKCDQVGGYTFSPDVSTSLLPALSAEGVRGLLSASCCSHPFADTPPLPTALLGEAGRGSLA